MSETPAPPEPAVTIDRWRDLRRHTGARIALSRAGASLPTTQVLEFDLAHAKARDAVHAELRVDALAERLRAFGHLTLATRSQAETRSVYLKRPDLGRRLPDSERQKIASLAAIPVDIAIIVADGLSPVAVQTNAPLLTRALAPRLRQDGLSIGPIVIVEQGRVAIGDEIGELLQAKLALMLIGERPGLSAADSLGVYSTFKPRPGRTDAERNCVSNIRAAGLPPEAAAATVHWLIRQTLALKLSGVALKETSSAEGELPAPPGLSD